MSINTSQLARLFAGLGVPIVPLTWKPLNVPRPATVRLGLPLGDRACLELGLAFLGPKTLRDGHPYTFNHTVPGLLELCDAVGTNVGLLPDARHWYTSGHDTADLELLDAKNVVDAHVNDAPAGVSKNEQVDSVRCLRCSNC